MGRGGAECCRPCAPHVWTAHPSASRASQAVAERPVLRRCQRGNLDRERDDERRSGPVRFAVSLVSGGRPEYERDAGSRHTWQTCVDGGRRRIRGRAAGNAALPLPARLERRSADRGAWIRGACAPARDRVERRWRRRAGTALRRTVRPPSRSGDARRTARGERNRAGRADQENARDHEAMASAIALGPQGRARDAARAQASEAVIISTLMEAKTATAEAPAPDAIAKELEEQREEVRRWTRARAVDSEQLDRLRNLASVWDAAAVAQHVRDAVAAAPLLTDPFPHLIIEPLLPDTAFRALVDSVPADEFFEGGKHLNLRGLGLSTSPVPLMTFLVWRSLRYDIIGPVLGPAIAERFRPHARDFLRISLGPEFV